MLDFLYQIIDILAPVSWLEPDFMKRAFLALIFIAPACAAMGVLVINFRMAFFSDAISHSAFTGVALGLLLGVNPMLTLVALGLLVGFGVTRIKEKSDLPTDTIIAVVFSIAVAFGIVIISARRGLSRTLEAFLYGNVLAVGETEVVMMAALLVAVSVFMALSYNKLFLIGINEDLAQTSGIKIRLYNYCFAAFLALVVTISIRVIGILLVTAMLIVPAASARNVAKNAGTIFWYSVVVSVVSAVAGLAASFKLDTATGAMVILVAGIFFAMTYPVRIWRSKRME